MPDEGRRTAHAPWGSPALVGVGETDYVRGSELHVCDLILDASMAAIPAAGLTPADLAGIIPPPGSMRTEQLAANQGIPTVPSHLRVLMAGAPPKARTPPQ